ncbi:MAG: enoyl-ACP reductase [Vulcanimicrobiaceae bacterium]
MGLLDGKTILVTGIANRWSIASGIAHRLYAHGATLVLTYQGERVEDAVRQHAAELGGAAVYECDVTKDESLRALAANAGRLDGLVHSIAFVKKEDLSGKVYDTSRDGFLMAMEISAYSLIALVGHLVDNLNDGASIMALTYLGGTQIVPNYNIAGIAKAALESTVRYLAFDLGERGIRVNAISAGPIKTASSRQVAGFSAMPAKVAAASPLRRNVTAEDVGNCAVYLASDLSSQVTADVHFVDAGYHAMGMYPEAAAQP